MLCDPSVAPRDISGPRYYYNPCKCGDFVISAVAWNSERGHQLGIMCSSKRPLGAGRTALFTLDAIATLARADTPACRPERASRAPDQARPLATRRSRTLLLPPYRTGSAAASVETANGRSAAGAAERLAQQPEASASPFERQRRLDIDGANPFEVEAGGAVVDFEVRVYAPLVRAVRAVRAERGDGGGRLDRKY